MHVFCRKSFQNIKFFPVVIVTGEMLLLSSHGVKKMFSVLYYKTYVH
jgi:hypothetical protein